MAAPAAAAAVRGVAGSGRAAGATGGGARAAAPARGRQSAPATPGRRAGPADGDDLLSKGFRTSLPGKLTKSSTRSGPQRMLIAEFLLCTVVLALSPLADKDVSAARWMKRGTAISAVFILLGMVSSIGPKAGKAAVALGGLITVVLVVDQRSIFGAIARRMRAGESDPGAAGQVVGEIAQDIPGMVDQEPPPRIIERRRPGAGGAFLAERSWGQL